MIDVYVTGSYVNIGRQGENNARNIYFDLTDLTTDYGEGTDPEYIEQITDYTENAAHDDAPDSAACLARLLYRKHLKRDGEDVTR